MFFRWLIFLALSLTSSTTLRELDPEVQSNIHKYAEYAHASYDDYTPMLSPDLVVTTIKVPIAPTDLKSKISEFYWKQLRLDVFERTVIFIEDKSAGRVAISFDGTVGASQWADNVANMMERIDIGDAKGISVHCGMNLEANTLLANPKVMQTLHDFKEQGYSFDFAVHSRAVAVAEIFLLKLNLQDPCLAASCWLYGNNGAAAGDSGFAGYYNSVFGDRTFNTYDQNDFVHSMVPPGFVHCGQQVSVSPNDVNLWARLNSHRIGNLKSRIASDLENPLNLECDLQDTLAQDEGLQGALAYISNLDEGCSVHVIPDDMTNAQSSHRNFHILVIKDSAAGAGIDAVRATASSLVFVLSDPNQKVSMKGIVKTATEAGVKSFAARALTSYGSKVASHFGVNVYDRSFGDQTRDNIGKAASTIVSASFHIAKGQFKEAGQTTFWGGVSIAASQYYSIPLDIGPGTKYISGGLFQKIHYGVLKSDVEVNFPLIQAGPFSVVTGGVSIGGAVEFVYDEKVCGMKMTKFMHQDSLVGIKAELFGLVSLNAKIGNTSVIGYAEDVLENGDHRLVIAKSNMKFGIINVATAGSRGHMQAFSILRETHKITEIIQYSERRNIVTGQRNMHLGTSTSSEMELSKMSDSHLVMVSSMLESLVIGRTTADIGEINERVKKKKALHGYSSQQSSKTIQKEYEEGGFKISHAVDQDGAEVTTISFQTEKGVDSFTSKGSKTYRVFGIKYKKGKGSSAKFSGHIVTFHEEGYIEIRTNPDGSKTQIMPKNSVEYGPRQKIEGVKNLPNAQNTPFFPAQLPAHWKYTFNAQAQTRTSEHTELTLDKFDPETGKTTDTSITSTQIKKDEVYLDIKASYDHKRQKSSTSVTGINHLASSEMLQDTTVKITESKMKDGSSIEHFSRQENDAPIELFTFVEVKKVNTDRLDPSRDSEILTVKGMYDQTLSVGEKQELESQIAGFDAVITRHVESHREGVFTSGASIGSNGNYVPEGQLQKDQQYLVEQTIESVEFAGSSAMKLEDVPAALGGDCLRENVKVEDPSVDLLGGFIQSNSYSPIGSNPAKEDDSTTILTFDVKKIDSKTSINHEGVHNGHEAHFKGSETKYSAYDRMQVESKYKGEKYDILGSGPTGIIGESSVLVTGKDGAPFAAEAVSNGESISVAFFEKSEIREENRDAIEQSLEGDSELAADLFLHTTRYKPETPEGPVTESIDKKSFVDVTTDKKVFDPVQNSIGQISVETYRETQTLKSFTQSVHADGSSSLTREPEVAREIQVTTGPKGAPIMSSASIDEIPVELFQSEIEMKSRGMKRPKVTILKKTTINDSYKDQPPATISPIETAELDDLQEAKQPTGPFKSHTNQVSILSDGTSATKTSWTKRLGSMAVKTKTTYSNHQQLVTSATSENGVTTVATVATSTNLIAESTTQYNGFFGGSKLHETYSYASQISDDIGSSIGFTSENSGKVKGSTTGESEHIGTLQDHSKTFLVNGEKSKEKETVATITSYNDIETAKPTVSSTSYGGLCSKQTTVRTDNVVLSTQTSKPNEPPTFTQTNLGARRVETEVDQGLFFDTTTTKTTGAETSDRSVTLPGSGTTATCSSLVSAALEYWKRSESDKPNGLNTWEEKRKFLAKKGAHSLLDGVNCVLTRTGVTCLGKVAINVLCKRNLEEGDSENPDSIQWDLFEASVRVGADFLQLHEVIPYGYVASKIVSPGLHVIKWCKQGKCEAGECCSGNRVTCPLGKDCTMIISTETLKRTSVNAAGGVGGAAVGGKIGAAVGIIGGPWGIWAGGVLGGAIGGFLGCEVGEVAVDKLEICKTKRQLEDERKHYAYIYNKHLKAEFLKKYPEYKENPRKVYKKKALKAHPDKGGNVEEFKEMVRLYEGFRVICEEIEEHERKVNDSLKKKSLWHKSWLGYMSTSSFDARLYIRNFFLTFFRNYKSHLMSTYGINDIHNFGELIEKFNNEMKREPVRRTMACVDFLNFLFYARKRDSYGLPTPFYSLKKLIKAVCDENVEDPMPLSIKLLDTRFAEDTTFWMKKVVPRPSRTLTPVISISTYAALNLDFSEWLIVSMALRFPAYVENTAELQKKQHQTLQTGQLGKVISVKWKQIIRIVAGEFDPNAVDGPLLFDWRSKKLQLADLPVIINDKYYLACFIQDSIIGTQEPSITFRENGQWIRDDGFGISVATMDPHGGDDGEHLLALEGPENGGIEEVIKVKGCIHALYLPIPQEGDLSKNLKPGLSNGAALCYLNSILQILIEIQRRFTLIPADTDFGANPVGFWIKEASKISVNLIDSQEISTLLGVAGKERYIMRDVNEVFMRLMQFGSLNSFKEIFTGLQQTSLKGQPSKPTEFICLNLQVKESISESIQQYLTPEEVEVEGEKVEKVEQFVALPKILALNLKRYQRRFGLVQKITDEVRLEELINIKVQNGSMVYKLFGCIVHDGFSVDTGHYYSIIRISDKWIKFNDEVVGAIPSIGDYCKGEASVYMAFYEREYSNNNSAVNLN